ncbi:hypothetical protein DB346_18095 [Verrucomicrobia bacterium LW23]|nr:hypothetical protein DB346_18095 [Verrucomicrobia bacterium LW23]
MLIDLDRFVRNERPTWARLDELLIRARVSPGRKLTLDEVRELHALYERTCDGLARVSNSVHSGQLRDYLEGLVAAAYAEIHDNRESTSRDIRSIRGIVHALVRYLTETLPITFRRRIMAFYISCGMFLLGSLFGALMLWMEPEAKHILIPGQFGHLEQTPTERVREEEASPGHGRTAGSMTRATAFYWTNNIRVGLVTAATGMLWGVGTLIALFFNGVILGLVAADFIWDGQGVFLIGWLLPHGSVEIPAIIVAGQVGLLLGSAIVGWGQRAVFSQRMRAVLPDMLTLLGGMAILLIWAGIVEAFFSQFHEPVLPYAVKILFGIVQLTAVTFYFTRVGKGAEESAG